MPLRFAAEPTAEECEIYPESDGKPMSETELHLRMTIYIWQLLDWRYQRPDVFVGCDMNVYWVEGNPRRCVVPDVFVALGARVLDAPRRIYQTWREGVPPTTAIEVTSRKTRRRDIQFKPEVYRRMGVAEYFLFDPTGDYLERPLKGFRRTGEKMDGDRFEPLELDDTRALDCRSLGLRLRVDRERTLRLIDAATGKRLLTEAEEATERADRAMAEADRAMAEAEAGRRRVAELEAELRRLRGEG